MTGLRYIGSAIARRTMVPRHLSPYVQWVGAHSPFHPSSTVSLNCRGWEAQNDLSRTLATLVCRMHAYGQKGEGATHSAGPG